MNGCLSGSEGFAHARRALELIAQHGLDPTPEHFAVWTAYLTDSVPELTEALQARLDGGGGLDAAFCRALYERWFTADRLRDAVIEAGESANRELVTVVETLNEANQQTAEYGEALVGASEALRRHDDIGSCRRLVEGLVAATARVQRRSTDLEARLRQTSTEVDRLRLNLEKVREEAMTDPLTGTANRKRFDLALRAARQDAEAGLGPFSLVLCDIDHFKRFNDAWGHQTGDQIIRFVAATLQRFTGASDLAARYGGEEFAVVMAGAGIERASAYAEKARQTIGAKRLLRKSTSEDLGHITVSFGCAEHRPGEPVEDLVERCDANLYAAKAAGRNRVVSDRPEPSPQPLKSDRAA